MMTVSDALRQTWAATAAEAAPQPGYYRRRVPLPTLHAVYAGIVRPGSIRWLSIEVEKSAFAGINVEDQTRGYVVSVDDSDSRQSDCVSIRVQEVGVLPARDLFLVFCSDLIENIGPCASGSEVLAALHSRLAHWKRFFQRRTPEGLSREEYIGLYAELDFFDATLVNIAAEVLTHAWQGPFGANQDFLFGTVAVEIKASTGNEPDSVRISNIRQLDDTGLDQLFLHHAAYDFRDGSGRTLPMLVKRLRHFLSTSAGALLIFEERLLAAGYVEPFPSAFERYGFTARFRRCFRVAKGFPRLLELQLPRGVSQVCYTLDLAACTAFEVPGAVVTSTIGG